MTNKINARAQEIIEDLRENLESDCEDAEELTQRALEALEDGECLAQCYSDYSQEEIELAYEMIKNGAYA